MTPARRLAEAFAREHVAEAAHFFETADAVELAGWLGALPVELAAAVVARAVPVAAAAALGHMQVAAAGAIVAALEPRAAAAVLRRLPESGSAAIVGELAPRAAHDLRLLMRYRSDRAGSRIDPRAPAVSPDTSAEQALQVVRQAADGALNYVYVIEDQQRLCGVVSMRELMLAAPTVAVRSVMIQNPHSVAADDPLEAVVRHPGWRKVHAMPVVDASGRFLGVIRYSQLRAIEAEVGRAPAPGRGAGTAAALAELFWLGSSAMARLGEAAVLGRLARDPQERR